MIEFSVALRSLLIFLCVMMWAPRHAVAQEDVVAEAAAGEIEEVLVTGEQPGPAMWKVTHGDNALWIIGELTPLPAGVTWRSSSVDAVIGEAQELLIDGGGRMAIGGLSALRFMVRFKKAQKLPKDQRLEDVVPAELYARFDTLRNEYAKGDPSLDRLLPLYAGLNLRNEVLKQLGLTLTGISQQVVRLAEDADVKVTTVKSKFGDPQKMLDYVERTSTTPCLEDTVTLLERGRSELQQLANAWSIGDLELLRQLVPKRQTDDCLKVVLGGADRVDAFRAEHSQAWLAAAEHALGTNRTTLALVQIDDLFSPSGRLAALRARGYVVEEP